MRYIFVLVLAAVLVIAAAGPATAQAVKCGPHDKVLDRLEKGYGEHPVGIGVTQQGDLLEIVASTGGSWSVVISKPNGITCLVAAGDGWRSLDGKGPKDPLAALPEVPDADG